MYSNYYTNSSSRNRQHNRPSFLKCFLIFTVLISVIYSVFFFITLYPLDLVSITNPNMFYSILTGSILGVLLGLVFASVTQFYHRLGDDDKAIIWAAGILYPVFAIGITVGIKFLFYLDWTLKIVLIGHVVAIVLEIIIIGCRSVLR